MIRNAYKTTVWNLKELNLFIPKRRWKDIIQTDLTTVPSGFHRLRTESYDRIFWTIALNSGSIKKGRICSLVVWLSECRQSIWEILVGEVMTWTQPAQDRVQCMILVRTSCTFHKWREIIEKPCTTSIPKTILHVTHGWSPPVLMYHSHFFSNTFNALSPSYSASSDHSQCRQYCFMLSSFIAISCDKLIIRPVTIITVPVTVTHMLWIIQSRYPGRRRPYLLQ